jgi:hypothetical protein
LQRLELPGADRVIDILLRNGIGLHQPLVAVLGDLSKRQIRFRCVEVAERLLQLLIDFRGFDYSQQFPLLHVGANIHIPLFQVPVGAGINRRGDKGLHVAGKNKFLCGRCTLGRHHRNRKNSHLSGLRLQLCARPDPRPDSRNQKSGDNDQCNHRG